MDEPALGSAVTHEGIVERIAMEDLLMVNIKNPVEYLAG
jgi:hypothetical protein